MNDHTMNDRLTQMALLSLGWDGSGNDVTFLVKLAGTLGVDLSALTQALLREQVRREVAEYCKSDPSCGRVVCPSCQYSKDGSSDCRQCRGVGYVDIPSPTPKGNGHSLGEPACSCSRFYDMGPCEWSCDLAAYRRRQKA